jgi:hypothetical protein
MKDEINTVNRACLHAAKKLCGHDERWQNCMMSEFGLNHKEMSQIKLLHTQSSRSKSQNPTVLFKLRSDRIPSAISALERGADYLSIDHKFSKETSVALSLYIGSLMRCLKEDVNEACLRFAIKPEDGARLLKYGTDEVVDAMMGNHVTFETLKCFKAKFTSSNDVDSTRFMLQDMHSFLKSNNILITPA